MYTTKKNQTFSEYPEIYFHNVDVLVRSYEVNAGESVIQGISYVRQIAKIPMISEI